MLVFSLIILEDVYEVVGVENFQPLQKVSPLSPPKGKLEAFSVFGFFNRLKYF
jgi:hypothetical protein